MEAALEERLTRPRRKPGASARAAPAPRVRYEIRIPRRRAPLLERLRRRLCRRKHELLATWSGDGEGSGRRTFEPPLRSPLQVWRLEKREARLLGAVGTGFLVRGVSLHDRGAEFDVLRDQASSSPCASA